MKTYFYFLLILITQNTVGQEKAVYIDREEKIETIKQVQNILEENYIFPEITDQIIALLDMNTMSGKYDSVNNAANFAQILTNDIQSFNHDRHLRVLFEPRKIAEKQKVISPEDSLQFEKKYIADLKRNNYFFRAVTILPGNIGYLDLRKFKDPKYAGITAVSAMNFLSNSDAIIIDLRNNGGGTPKMVQLLASYFFDSEVVQLSSVYKRNEKITKQFWTLPFVSGKRMSDIPLYILTSNRTFSAAEQFAYDLQSLKRAFVIGEVTGGGAHPGGRIKATEKFNVWTPTGRAINPITKSNWEKIGVIPHHKVAAEDALLTARIMALDSLKKKKVHDKKYYEWHLQLLNSVKKPFDIDVSILKTYEGTYGIRSIRLENDTLFYKREDGPKLKLIPINNNTFIFDNQPDFRIKFSKDKNETLRLLGLYEDGKVITYAKTE